MLEPQGSGQWPTQEADWGNPWPEAGSARPDTLGPIRVLKVVNNFEAGGTEGQVSSLVGQFDPEGVQLSLACLGRHGVFLKDYQRRGLSITEYPLSSLCSWRAPRHVLALARSIRLARIEVVHAYNFHALALALPAARLARVPLVIASIRDRGVYLDRRQRLLLRLLCRLAHRVLVNAEAIRQWLVQEGCPGERIEVIRNGISVARYQQADASFCIRREYGFPALSPLVVMIARMHPDKGVEEFIRAAARVYQRQPAARFLLVGEWRWEGQVEDGSGNTAFQHWQALIAELGLEGKLLFTGHRDDLPRWLTQVTVSVLPSRDEGISNALLESMAAGVPVVATRVGGTPELIDAEVDGLLVEVGDIAALAEAVSQLLHDSEQARQLGRAGQAKAMQRFSIEAMARDTLALYRRELGRAPPEQTAGLVLRTVHSAAELAPWRVALESLAARAEQPNPFYEPALLFPALRHFGAGEHFVFVLVFAPASEAGNAEAEGERLCAFLPLVERRRFHGLPVANLELWRWEHCYLCSPLVDASKAVGVAAAVFDWFIAQPRYKLLRASQVAGQGAWHEAMQAALRRRQLRVSTEAHTRPLLTLERDAESYFNRHFSASFRKQMRRKRRQLEAAGTLCCTALEPGDDLAAWLRTFEVLEVSGHKAQSALAIANSQAARDFFHQALAEAFVQGRLMMLALRFEGRVIAMLINLLAAEGGFAYKVAYDEAFARYSPGVMLDMEMIQRLHAEGRIRWLDACTDPGVKCFQSLFCGVKPIQQLCIANQGALARSCASLLPLARRMKRRLRRSQS